MLSCRRGTLGEMSGRGESGLMLSSALTWTGGASLRRKRLMCVRLGHGGKGGPFCDILRCQAKMDTGTYGSET